MIYLLGVTFVFSLLSLNLHSFLLYFCICYRFYFTQLQLTVFLINVFHHLSYMVRFFGIIEHFCQMHCSCDHHNDQNTKTAISLYVSSTSDHCFAFSLSFWCCQVEFCTRLRRICHNVTWNCQKCYMDLSKLLHGFVKVVMLFLDFFKTKTMLMFDQDFEAYWNVVSPNCAFFRLHLYE